MLPPHIWAAVFSQLEDPTDNRALAVASKATALIAADTYRRRILNTVCQLRAVAMEARHAFKHRKAEVFVDCDSASSLSAVAHLETLQVAFAHMREAGGQAKMPDNIYTRACHKAGICLSSTYSTRR